MLEVITGPMYSGKSTELIRRLERASIAGKNVVLLRPRIDDRYSDQHLISHNGSQMEAQKLSSPGELYQAAFDWRCDVIGIDEAQFLDTSFINNIDRVSDHVDVIVTGLDTTYRIEPFGIMPHLMSIADRLTKLSAVCHKCGEDATRTQRLVDGRPAPFDAPTVLVGGTESYEARCRKCVEIG